MSQLGCLVELLLEPIGNHTEYILIGITLDGLDGLDEGLPLIRLLRGDEEAPHLEHLHALHEGSIGRINPREVGFVASYDDEGSPGGIQDLVGHEIPPADAGIPRREVLEPSHVETLVTLLGARLIVERHSLPDVCQEVGRCPVGVAVG